MSGRQIAERVMRQPRFAKPEVRCHTADNASGIRRWIQSRYGYHGAPWRTGV